MVGEVALWKGFNSGGHATNNLGHSNSPASTPSPTDWLFLGARCRQREEARRRVHQHRRPGRRLHLVIGREIVFVRTLLSWSSASSLSAIPSASGFVSTIKQFNSF
jgi:hypothetical protein